MFSSKGTLRRSGREWGCPLGLRVGGDEREERLELAFLHVAELAVGVGEAGRERLFGLVFLLAFGGRTRTRA